jgi:hypothetical protein
VGQGCSPVASGAIVGWNGGGGAQLWVVGTKQVEWGQQAAARQLTCGEPWHCGWK